MEIWECLSIAYTKIRSQSVGLQMVIASLPPVPTHERHFDIFNLSVHSKKKYNCLFFICYYSGKLQHSNFSLIPVSLPPSEIKNLPRVGEILLVSFGPENSRHQRFFFVHNVRGLPSPPGTDLYLFVNIFERFRIVKR